MDLFVNSRSRRRRTSSRRTRMTSSVPACQSSRAPSARAAAFRAFTSSTAPSRKACLRKSFERGHRHARSHERISSDSPRKKDARGIYLLIKTSVENEELLPRSRAEIERQIGDYYVFEIDGNLAGCMRCIVTPTDQGRDGMRLVAGKYENQESALGSCNTSKTQAATRRREFVLLTTQAVNTSSRRALCAWHPTTCRPNAEGL